MALLLKHTVLAVLIAAGLALGALPARAYVSIGVGFSTGRVGFGFATYAPLYVFDHVYTSTSSARYLGGSAPIYVGGGYATPITRAQLKKTPRPPARSYREYSHSARPPGYHSRPPGYGSRGHSGYGKRGYPGYYSRGYDDDYFSGRYDESWKRNRSYYSRGGSSYFGQRYDRHFSSKPRYPNAYRPPYPYQSAPPPSAYRPPYGDGPRIYGRFTIEP